MGVYRIERFGSVDGIVPRSSENPRPDVREVLMRVRASSLNYRDLMVLEGRRPWSDQLGVIPLSDGAGEVAAIGHGVTRAIGLPVVSIHAGLAAYQARIPD